jgi:hypothetical protein
LSSVPDAQRTRIHPLGEASPSGIEYILRVWIHAALINTITQRLTPSPKQLCAIQTYTEVVMNVCVLYSFLFLLSKWGTTRRNRQRKQGFKNEKK